jgi:hypothetical protein
MAGVRFHVARSPHFEILWLISQHGEKQRKLPTEGKEEKREGKVKKNIHFSQDGKNFLTN